MKNFNDLRKKISECTIVSQELLSDVEAQIFSSGKISEEEAQFVYEVCYDVIRKSDGQECLKAWQDLFVKVIVSFVLDDDKSKGEIDDVEAIWLENKIKCDKAMMDIEKALLKSLSEKSKNFPKCLSGIF